MKVQAYIYHKRAEKYSDCQDYFGIDSQNNRIAVSDGMSQSIYPQWWAKILVNAYLDKGRIPVLPEEIQIYQDVWQDEVQAEIARREAIGINPWRLKNAFAEKSGAGATLCGFTWDVNGWDCECIGDSSVIVINEDYTIKILSSQEGEFGNHPDYLDSFHNGRGNSKQFNGSFKGIIGILLVTDPYSELFQKHLSDKEFIKTCFEKFLSISNHQSYCELVERYRDTLDMHNDDSTLIVLSDFSSSEYLPQHVDKLEELCRNEGTPEKVSNTAEACDPKISTTTSVVEEAIKDETPIMESSDIQLECGIEATEREFIHIGLKLLQQYKGNNSKHEAKKYLKKFIPQILKKFFPKK